MGPEARAVVELEQVGALVGGHIVGDREAGPAPGARNSGSRPASPRQARAAGAPAALGVGDRHLRHRLRPAARHRPSVRSVSTRQRPLLEHQDHRAGVALALAHGGDAGRLAVVGREPAWRGPSPASSRTGSPNTSSVMPGLRAASASGSSARRSAIQPARSRAKAAASGRRRGEGAVATISRRVRSRRSETRRARRLTCRRHGRAGHLQPVAVGEGAAEETHRRRI